MENLAKKKEMQQFIESYFQDREEYREKERKRNKEEV
jgi:hypothetical protein